ncbi:unnamed protein product [Boreogadus saida]
MEEILVERGTALICDEVPEAVVLRCRTGYRFRFCGRVLLRSALPCSYLSAPLSEPDSSQKEISDGLQQSYATSVLWQFLSLGYALMLCPFVIVLGGMFFLATALFFLDDREKAEKQPRKTPEAEMKSRVSILALRHQLSPALPPSHINVLEDECVTEYPSLSISLRPCPLPEHRPIEQARG